jgi:hypothetical protein
MHVDRAAGALHLVLQARGDTNLSNLPMPMAASLVPLLIVLTGLLFVVVAVNIYTFHSASAELNKSLDAIIAHDPAAKTSQP